MASTPLPMPTTFTPPTPSSAVQHVVAHPEHFESPLRAPHTTLLVHGSFFLADCVVCEWTGSARRVRHTAVRDALRHRGACPGTA